jgi:acetyl esterase/lipase
MLAATLMLALMAPKVDVDVVYSKAAGEELKMDIHYPESPRIRPSPAVVVIHGGGWVSGNKRDMADMSKGLAEQGFLAANVQYRLAPKHKWPTMLDDVQTAVRYLRANAKRLEIDPKRIGAAGASAGGHLSLLLGYRDTRAEKVTEYPGHSSKVQAVFDIFGPADLDAFPTNVDTLFVLVLGKERAKAGKEIREGSPATYVGPGSAPTFILHGTADALVPIAQSRDLYAALKKRGVPVEMFEMPGVGHEVPVASADKAKRENALAGVLRGVEFLKRHLEANR